MKKIIFKFPIGIDVIHVNSSQEGIFVGNFEKTLVTEHGWPDPRLVESSERKYYERERNALLQLYEIGVPIVTISNYSAEMLHNIYGVKVSRVIYHGLLKNFLSNRPRKMPRKHRVLWVSRLVSIKEPFILLEALKKISDKAELKTVIKGSGPLHGIIKKYIENYNLKSSVSVFSEIIPFREMPKIYSSCSIFIHTCSHEPFGLAVLEAMGSALPVLVPDRGGAPEVAGNAAFKFRAGDPDDLCEKLLNLMDDEELYEKLSEKSLERAREFSWQRAAKEYFAIYKLLWRI
ncbi:MAG: glycosyltransferase family 4 protein [Candidatus Bathyarchaeia archaeon]